MIDKLSGKVALVTGGSSGIGKAAALIYAREGAKVVVADIDLEGGQSVVKEIEAIGGQAIFVKVDVSQKSDVEAMVDKTIASYGQLDCAFNNAGIEGTVGIPISQYSEDNWDKVIGINLKGVWLCMKYELAHMAKNGRGSIVNTSSIAGLIGGTFGSAYYASKHGVIGLTKSAAVEYGQVGIRVNAVCPGVIRTEMADRIINDDQNLVQAITAQHPIGRLGTAEEVAETVVWLSSDAASFVTGQAMPVDGGYVAQ